MKRIITIIFILFSVLAFSQDGNVTDAKGKKQGLWKKYYANGMLYFVGNFKDDKPVGEFNYFYDSGKLQVKITHFGNVSYANMYYETGELKATGKYENQVKDSIWTYYTVTGSTAAEEFYLSGKRNGTWKVYYPSNKMMEEKDYMNDIEEGNWKQYYENGKPKMTATYVKGALEGRATYYDANGKKAVSGIFYHDVREGFWTYYEKDGLTVRKKEEYKNGKRIDENKDDNVIDPRETEYESEDILNPDIIFSPR